MRDDNCLVDSIIVKQSFDYIFRILQSIFGMEMGRSASMNIGNMLYGLMNDSRDFDIIVWAIINLDSVSRNIKIFLCALPDGGGWDRLYHFLRNSLGDLG